MALDSIGGARGLQVAQVAAVAIACCLVAADARRRGAGDRSTAIVLVAVIPAAFAAIVAIRAQLFSLALFPALALLLRAEARRPSRLIWLIPPLLALWSNLHGAALTGLAVAGAYLLLDRARREPLVAAGVLLASLAGLCLTPALQDTPAYYASVLGGEAARQGIGLWAPFSFSSGPDIATLVCLALAVWPLVRARPKLWEIVALAGLAVLAARTARGGVWVVLFAAPLVASGLPWGGLRRSRFVPLVLVACAVLVVFGIARGPLNTAASARVLDRALSDAHGTPMIADSMLAEQVALAGGRVYVANPIDAFSRADQRLWIAWLEGQAGGRRRARARPSCGVRGAPWRCRAPHLEEPAVPAGCAGRAVGGLRAAVELHRRACARRSARAAASRSDARRRRAPRARRARAPRRWPRG